MNLKDYIRSIPDYPKKGILFRDITTLIKNEIAFTETINQIIESYKIRLKNKHNYKDTFLKKRPSNASKSKAKLLQNLLVNIKFCELNWCSIEIIKNKTFLGWVEKKYICGSTKNNF